MRASEREHQQVLFFSCHPEFADIFARSCREPEHQDAVVTIYHIDDGVIQRSTGLNM